MGARAESLVGRNAQLAQIATFLSAELRAPAEVVELTAREREIFGLVAAAPDAEITGRLAISSFTIRRLVFPGLRRHVAVTQPPSRCRLI